MKKDKSENKSEATATKVASDVKREVTDYTAATKFTGTVIKAARQGRGKAENSLATMLKALAVDGDTLFIPAAPSKIQSRKAYIALIGKNNGVHVKCGHGQQDNVHGVTVQRVAEAVKAPVETAQA